MEWSNLSKEDQNKANKHREKWQEKAIFPGYGALYRLFVSMRIGIFRYHDYLLSHNPGDRLRYDHQHIRSYSNLFFPC